MPTRRAEEVTAVGRDEAPSDVQLTRAFIAAAVGLVLALCLLRPAVDAPSIRSLLPELRAVAGVPTLVIRFATGDF
jgi:hypothetical protein